MAKLRFEYHSIPFQSLLASMPQNCPLYIWCHLKQELNRTWLRTEPCGIQLETLIHAASHSVALCRHGSLFLNHFIEFYLYTHKRPLISHPCTHRILCQALPQLGNYNSVALLIVCVLQRRNSHSKALRSVIRGGDSPWILAAGLWGW